jgi:putative transposase
MGGDEWVVVGAGIPHNAAGDGGTRVAGGSGSSLRPNCRGTKCADSNWRGFVYVTFVINVFWRRIGGWRAHSTMRTDLVLDASEQALHDRLRDGDLVVHSDRGSQHVAMRYTGRLAATGAAPSVGSVGDAYDNALAETLIGLFKTEVIHRDGPWRGFEDVEMATLEWVAWFNQERLLAPQGSGAPAQRGMNACNNYRAHARARTWTRSVS